MPVDAPLLIAYDGSANARAAIDAVAALMPGASATVLYARQPLESVAAHLEGHPALEDLRGLDAATLDASQQIAEEGAEHARAASTKVLHTTRRPTLVIPAMDVDNS